jgi:hypothetical protein
VFGNCGIYEESCSLGAQAIGFQPSIAIAHFHQRWNSCGQAKNCAASSYRFAERRGIVQIHIDRLGPQAANQIGFFLTAGRGTHAVSGLY